MLVWLAASAEVADADVEGLADSVDVRVAAFVERSVAGGATVTMDGLTFVAVGSLVTTVVDPKASLTAVLVV